MKKMCRKRKRRVSILAAMLLCAVIGIAGTVMNMNRTHHTPPAAAAHTAAVETIR